MNAFADIRTLVTQSLEAMVEDERLPRGLSFDAVTVEPPRDASHGDMACNAAMVLAKPAEVPPREIAADLAGRLAKDPRIDTAEVAGPGFINLRMTAAVWHGVLGAALEAGEGFGRGTLAQPRRVNVEYVSANPTGPLHVGHTRGAVFGDALASLLAFAGHEVTREYYVNDGGAQIDALARSVYLRYLEALGREVSVEAGAYPGDYLVPVGRALADKIGDAWADAPEEAWLAEVRAFATDAMMELIRGDLAALGVSMDVYSSERALYGTGRIEAAIDVLRDRGLIYEGTLDPPKGKAPEDWEPRRQTLFRSTARGDDVDRPVKKSDGAWTYFAPDIAYHYDKIQRGFDELVDVFGADHGGYVKRMQAAVSALSDGQVPLAVHLMQTVRLLKDGEPFQMSKRAGTFVLLSDLIEEVSAGVVRFVMLTAPPRRALGLRLRPRPGAIARQPGVLRPVRQRAGPLGAAARGGRGRGDGRRGAARRRSLGALARGRDRGRAPRGRVAAPGGDRRAHARAPPGGVLSLRPCLGVPRAVEPRQRRPRAALPAGRSGRHSGQARARPLGVGGDRDRPRAARGRAAARDALTSASLGSRGPCAASRLVARAARRRYRPGDGGAETARRARAGRRDRR